MLYLNFRDYFEISWGRESGAWGMDIKEFPLSLQVETGIPRAVFTSSCSYYGIKRRGVGGWRRLVCQTFGGVRPSGLPGEPGDLLWSGTGIQPQEEGLWEVWKCFQGS